MEKAAKTRKSVSPNLAKKSSVSTTKQEAAKPFNVIEPANKNLGYSDFIENRLQGNIWYDDAKKNNSDKKTKKDLNSTNPLADSKVVETSETPLENKAVKLAPSKAIVIAPVTDKAKTDDAVVPKEPILPKEEKGKKEGKAKGEVKEKAIPKAPKNAASDPQFQKVAVHISKTGTRLKQHPDPKAKLSETKDASHLETTQQNDKNDQSAHMGTMEAVAEKSEKQPITPESFKKILQGQLDSLEKQLPKDEAAAERFNKEKPIEKMKQNVASTVNAERAALAGPMDKEAKEEKAPASNLPTTNAIPLKAEATPKAPIPIDAKKASPKPKTSQEISMEKESQSLDDQMAENDITDEQLAKSNEPKFTGALESKNEAKKEAKAAPGHYRKKERNVLGMAQNQAMNKGQMGFGGMMNSQISTINQVFKGQGLTSTSDKDKQRDVNQELKDIYNQTKKNVSEILDKLSESVDKKFEEKAGAAKATFEKNVEEGLGEIYGWFTIDDWLFGEDTDAIEDVFRVEKGKFVSAMDAAFDEIAQLISDELNKAIKEIKKGRKDTETHFNSLTKEQQRLANDTMNQLGDQYDTLEDTVYEKQEELAGDLASAYNEKVGELRESFDAIKEKVSATWIEAAFNAIKGVIETILKLKDLLLNLLSAVIDAVKAIISDPIGFLKNLFGGIRLGISNFMANLKKNIITGLIEWLTGSLGGVGITIPDNLFSLSGIFDLVTQILGLSKEYFRAKAVKLLGEPTVNAMEKGLEIFQIVKEKGVMGLWEHIKEQFTDLKEMVMDAIRDMIMTKVVEAGIKWMLGLLSPAGAFIKAVMLIVDVVKFFIERAAQIIELVSAFVDSIRALANGGVGQVAAAIEKALTKAIPILIGFLAALVGVTGLTGKVQKIIKRVRKRIDKAITKLILKAKKKFRKLMKKGKAGVKKVVGKIVSWWKAKKEFKTKNGEKHKLFFKGNGASAKLMIASEEMTFQSFIRDLEGSTGTNAESEAVRIAKLIDAKKNEGLGPGDKVAKERARMRKQAEIEVLLGQLAPHAATLLGLQGVAIPVSSGISYTPKTIMGTKLGFRMNADVLTKRGDPGSAPSVNNSLWDKLTRRRNQGGSYYVRGHLLNHNVHGPGNTWNNLTVLSRKGNKNHLDEAEKLVKIAVDSGAIVRYWVIADYKSKIKKTTSDAELRAATQIRQDQWEITRDIRSIESEALPEKLLLSAQLLEPNGSGGYNIKKTLVINKKVDNPVEFDLTKYQIDGGQPLEKVSLTETDVDIIARNTEYDEEDLSIIVDAAKKVKDAGGLYRYQQIIDKMLELGTATPLLIRIINGSGSDNKGLRDPGNNVTL